VGWRKAAALPDAAFVTPDSAQAQRAAALVRELSPAFLVHHCERTYAFGVALGAALGKRYDRELLYLAAILHDLGLTEAHRGERPFELRGADAAYRFCVDQGMAAEHCERVHEAIALHTSLEAARGEPEVALLHLGAGMDVVGYRSEDLRRETVEAVVAGWPRLQFKRRFCELLSAEARLTPDSPLGVQWRLGFSKRVLNAPFAE
jgi:hypothetical protein